jgi:malate dehydrogenase (oxaloacetate-decarboxylating)(NADP+)
MMVHMGDADALVSGVNQHFPDTIRPALQVIKVRPGVHKVAGLYALVTRKGDLLFLGDCSVNIEPTAEELAEIALCAAEAARRFDVEPRIAMLSFSNFGSTRHPQCEKMRLATEMVKQADPDLNIDGEIMADLAVTPEVLQKAYPFSTLRGGANILIFPDLNAANIAYKLLMKVGGAEAIGPMLMGMSKPVYVLPRGSEEEDVVNITALAVVDAQESSRPVAAPELVTAG